MESVNNFYLFLLKIELLNKQLKLNSETTYLVGNKRDLEAQREVSQEKGKKVKYEDDFKHTILI